MNSNIIIEKLVDIAKQKSALLKAESEMWVSLSDILSKEKELLPIKNKVIHAEPQRVNNIEKNLSDIVRLPEVIKRVGLARSTIYSYVEKGLFPAPRKIGIKSIGWLEKDIQEWILAKSNA